MITRIFVLLINDLKEAKENLSIILRCIPAAFFLSHSLRLNTYLLLYFWRENKGALFITNRLKNIRVDEQSLSGVFRRIARAVRSNRVRISSVHTGVIVAKKKLEEYLGKWSKFPLYFHSLRGSYIREVQLSEPLVFVSPLTSYNKGQISILKSYGGKPLRVSVNENFPDIYFVLVNNELDRSLWRLNRFKNV